MARLGIAIPQLGLLQQPFDFVQPGPGGLLLPAAGAPDHVAYILSKRIKSVQVQIGIHKGLAQGFLLPLPAVGFLNLFLAHVMVNVQGDVGGLALEVMFQ